MNFFMIIQENYKKEKVLDKLNELIQLLEDEGMRLNM